MRQTRVRADRASIESQRGCGAIAAGQIPAASEWDVYPIAPVVAQPRIPQRLGIPATVRGVFADDDMPVPGGNEGSVCDNYILDLTAGEPITIVARGEAEPPSSLMEPVMDVTACLYFRRRALVWDDNSATAEGDFTFNSRIVFTPTITGMYLLEVATRRTRGDYSVQTYRGARPAQL